MVLVFIKRRIFGDVSSQKALQNLGEQSPEKLKEKWERQAQKQEELSKKMRPKIVSRLAGFILSLQEADRAAPVARVRRSFKQAPDMVFKAR